MTAFARREADAEWGAATWELRSVNFRYLDVSPRMPDELRALEPIVRERAGQRIKRGKLECTLKYKRPPHSDADFRVDLELADRLAKASREVDTVLFNPGPVNSMEILRWPGVIQTSALDLEVVGKHIVELLDLALDDLVDARSREGEKIARMIQERCGGVEAVIEGVSKRLPLILQGARERLVARLSELRETLDADRLEQEMVLFAQKIDVAEELERLGAHSAEVRRVLMETKAVGRHLDFLMQEMNREANTLASKSSDIETTRAAVDVKVLVEQMREQIQNVE